MPEQRQILQVKAKKVDETVKTIQNHKIIALASLHKVRARQLQVLRKKLQDDVYIKVIKNSLMKRAIKKCKNRPNLDKLKESLQGSTIYLFTNLNPFNLILLLDKSKIKTTAKTGDTAAFDVIVPAGNTGQPPGPIISQLAAVGLKTRIESGSVWITKDTLVVEKDETISERLAPILSKLGIKPVEAGLVLTTAYDNGVIYAGEQLHLDLDATKKTIETAYRSSFYLSVNIVYPTPRNITFLLKKAYRDAYRLGLNQNIPTKETIVEILRNAYLQMVGLKTRLNIRVEVTTEKD
jgi:large subunit ribosomal protein L10